jgi:TRAP-type mannitol/chloroaromatic compound transport system permease small subunit
MGQIQTQIQIQTGPRDRTTVLLRGILVAPVMIFLGSFSSNFSQNNTNYSLGYVGGLLVAPAFLAILFRRTYPTYVYSFNRAIMELSARVFSYLFLLTDDYPSIEANPKIKIDFPDIENGKKLNQFMPLLKWFLAIPLFLVGIVYFLYALFITFFAWIFTVLNGTYPEWAGGPVLGTMAYFNRVSGYAIILVTDEYPSFSLTH